MSEPKASWDAGEKPATFGTMLIAETALVEPKKVIGRPFVKGDPNIPKSPGRPKKGETLKERLARKDAAVASKAIKARDKRLVRDDLVGERAWTTYLAYNVGLPKQVFVHEGIENPLASFLVAAYGSGFDNVSRETIEAEHTLLDSPAD